MFPKEFKEFFKELGSEFVGFFKKAFVKYGIISFLAIMTIMMFLAFYTLIIDF